MQICMKKGSGEFLTTEGTEDTEEEKPNSFSLNINTLKSWFVYNPLSAYHVAYAKEKEIAMGDLCGHFFGHFHWDVDGNG